MTTIYPPPVFPVGYDSFMPRLVDHFDVVLGNHPNTSYSAIEAIEQKLGINNDPILGLGGVCFDAFGKAANPGAPGIPTIWVSNFGGSPFPLYYTDDTGTTVSLSTQYWARTGTKLYPAVSGDYAEISIPDTTNTEVLKLIQLDATNNPSALIISNAGTGASILFQGATRRISSDTGNLTISTLTSGTLALSSVGDLDLDGRVTTLDTITLSIDSTDTTNLTMTANSAGTKTLTISSSNIGAGVANLDVDADGAVTIDGLSFSIDGTTAGNVSVTSNSLTLSTLVSGTLYLTSAGVLDIDGLGTTLDATTLSIDSTDTTNLTMTANSAGLKVFTISASNAGAGDGELSLYGDILVLYDSKKAGSTYSADFVFSSSSAEWNTFETNYGEVSLLNAINQAGIFEVGAGTLSAQRKGASLSTLGDYAVNTGYSNTINATADYSVVLGGKSAVARWPYAMYHASGAYSEGTAGDNQVIVDVPMWNRTDNSDWTQIYIDGRGGSGLKLTTQVDGLYQVHAMITANCTNYVGRCAAWEISALVNNASGTTTLLNSHYTLVHRTSAGTESSWDVRITANDTDDTIQFEVLGTYEERIRWQASIRVVEVIRKDPIFGWVATGALPGTVYRLDDLCVNGGVLYASGVVSGVGSYIGRVWSYDPSLDTWTSRGDVGVAKFGGPPSFPYLLASLGGVLYCSVGAKGDPDPSVYSLTPPSTWVSCGTLVAASRGVRSFAADGTTLYITTDQVGADGVVYKWAAPATWNLAGAPKHGLFSTAWVYSHGTTIVALTAGLSWGHTYDSIKTYAGGTSWTDIGLPTYSNAGYPFGLASDGLNLYVGHVPDVANPPEIFSYTAPATWNAKGVLSANGQTLLKSMVFNSGELFAGSTSDYVDKFTAPSTWEATGKPEAGSDATAGGSLGGSLYFVAGTTVYVRVIA